MSTTPDCVTAVVQWVRFDNKLKEYNDKIKLLRAEKTKWSGLVFDQMNLGHPDNPDDPDEPLPQFSIESLGTNVKVSPKKTYESLNYKFMTGCLREYFKDEDDSEEKAKDIIKFIQQQRTATTLFTLTRDAL